MAATKRDTVRLLCKSIITRLENRETIQFPPRLRQIVQDEIFGLVGPSILTEEDLRERTLARLGAKSEALQETGITESDQYKTAKKMVREQFGDDELNGFFFQKPVKHIAQAIGAYLMRSSHIDEVFEEDAELERQIVETIQKFDPAQLH
jgi:hypothetical protein